MLSCWALFLPMVCFVATPNVMTGCGCAFPAFCSAGGVEWKPRWWMRDAAAVDPIDNSGSRLECYHCLFVAVDLYNEN
jgi:hypothetical protein